VAELAHQLSMGTVRAGSRDVADRADIHADVVPDDDDRGHVQHVVPLVDVVRTTEHERDDCARRIFGCCRSMARSPRMRQ